MNEQTRYIFQIDQLPVMVIFKPNIISIDFTPYSSTKDLKILHDGFGSLLPHVKDKYQELFQSELLISDCSLMAEVWGHLVAYRVAIWVEKHLGIFKKPAKFIAFRSGLVDCGEKQVDTNRWFWDILGKWFFRRYRNKANKKS